MTDPLAEVRVAIDAMGGDHGAAVMVGGAALALERHPDVRFVFFGREAEVSPLLQAKPALARRSRLHHTDVAVKMGDKPSQALRAGRRVSSMWLAIDAVKAGEADVAVSAGNTGALMAMAKICLRTMADVDRPAIAAIWPTLRGRSIVLDVGASIGADAQTLVDLAVMGAAMARIVLDIERPTVGLLNVGTEEVKGLEEVKAASRLLREADLPALDYRGFVEGDDLGAGSVDVVVTEGFSGNIALKTAEGTAKQIRHYIRSALGGSWRAKLAYLIARDAFDGLRSKMDVRHVNGGVFLGLNGIVIKSHGSMDEVGTAGAIDLGCAMVRHRLLERISETLVLAAAHQNPATADAAAGGRPPPIAPPTAARTNPT